MDSKHYSGVVVIRINEGHVCGRPYRARYGYADSTRLCFYQFSSVVVFRFHVSLRDILDCSGETNNNQ